MSSVSKRKKEDISSSSDEEDDNENEDELDSSEDNEDVQNINVEFEAESPTENDFHGIKQLLLRALILLHVDASELTDIILSQDNVGSTAKIVDDEEDEVYGIFSVISLRKFQEKACIKELQKELLSKCKSHQTKAKYEQLEDILQNKNVGYLVNERFINIPSQLAGPFHQSLFDEVQEAKKEDKTFEFSYLILIAKTLKPTNITEMEKEESSLASKKKKKKKKIETDENSDVMEYTNFEDEIFHKASEMSFSYSVTEATGLAVSGSWDFGDEPMKTYRTIMIVPIEKWKNVLKTMKEMVEK